MMVEGAHRGGDRAPAPSSWAAMNGSTEAGAIPAKVSVTARPMVTCGSRTAPRAWTPGRRAPGSAELDV